MVHEYQIHESFNLGADIVLLIASCLKEKQLEKLHQCAVKLGMATLVEVHNEEEAERVLKTGCTMMGINNRDLKTFEVDINTAFRVKKAIPPDIPVICESGISSTREIQRLKEAGFAGALIGGVPFTKERMRGKCG